MTKACLNLSGKTPPAGDRFMMVVIWVRTSKHSLMMKVGQGSKSQDLVGDLDRSFSTNTSSSVNEQKERTGGAFNKI